MSIATSLFRAALRPRPPIVAGTLAAVGIDGPVTIRRDRWHVPHVDATAAPDAWFGFGFAQGQDRAFQIAAFAHIAAGRLSDLVGTEGLPVDRLMRRLDLHGRAARTLPLLSDPVRESMRSFAAGVNAGMTVGMERAAVEFTLLRTRPPTLTAVDIAAIARVFAFSLAANWQDEIARLTVLEQDGADALRRLDDRASSHLPTTIGRDEGPVTDALEADIAVLEQWLPLGGASNNWVLSGQHTASGRPLVANDPHLPPMLPNYWYLGHLRCPDWEVAGAGLIGMPAIAAGHNGFGAWGVTAGHCDDTDLFLEEVDGDRVRDGDGWVTCKVRREVIAVRGGKDVVEECVDTPRGPIVGPALGGAPHGLSMAGTWLDEAPIDGFMALPSARSVTDFRDAFRRWPAMSFNVVWGDRDGHIAWQVVGELPLRRSGNGTLPLPGWDPTVGWTGRVAYDDMPHAIDPDSGVLATANNVPMPHADGPFLGMDHLEGYRVGAILEVLRERHDWDVPATLLAQQDTRSLPWRDLAPLLLGSGRPAEPDAAAGWDLLDGWDGDVAADSPAASIYELTVAGLRRRVLQRLAPGATGHLLAHTPVPGLIDEALLGLRGTAHLVRSLADPDGVLDSVADVEVAMASAVRELRRRFGSDARQWKWGDVRPLRLRHPVSNAAPPLAAVFDRGPFPIGGDAHTIPQASSMPHDPLGHMLGSVTLKMAVDTGDWEASRWVLPGGQSGDPTSPHYDDQIPRFLAGAGIPIPWSPLAVEAATRSTLTLHPA